MNLVRFIPRYETHIYGGGREPAFLMLLAFILLGSKRDSKA
jgi:hypothetical protein